MRRAPARAAALAACAAGCGGCDSVAVHPSACAAGLGGMYGKNADRHRSEAQPIGVVPRKTWPAGSTITFDTGLTIPQAAVTYAHAGSRPAWAHPYGGYSMCVNEYGVGIGNEQFPSRSLPTDDGKAPQTEFTDLARLVCERAKNAAEAIQVFTDMVGKYGQTCKTCPEAGNYNSLFMISDTTEIYSAMAVGHEWGWKKFEESDLDGTGVWSISNLYFPGATNVSATAASTAEAQGWWKPSKGAFDFGKVYGEAESEASGRQKKTQKLLRAAAKDHPLTKEDLMATLSTAPIDRISEVSSITASSMISDFTTNGSRRIAWHALTNPSLSVYYPVFFYHDGLASAYDDWMSSTEPWFDFRRVSYTLCTSSAKRQYVKDTWKPIQQRFLRGAEEAAEQAAGMVAEDATALLTDFTKNVSATIRATLAHFNETLPAM